MGVISIVIGIINQLITGGAPPCNYSVISIMNHRLQPLLRQVKAIDWGPHRVAKPFASVAGPKGGGSNLQMVAHVEVWNYPSSKHTQNFGKPAIFSIDFIGKSTLNGNFQ